MIAAAIHDRELGAFAEWQPRYAQHGIATFPVVIDGSGKRPAVKGYLKVGSDLSRHLALRFAANDAFGFALGRYNRITVLDVDTRDDREGAEAFRTPIPAPCGSVAELRAFIGEAMALAAEHAELVTPSATTGASNTRCGASLRRRRLLLTLSP